MTSMHIEELVGQARRWGPLPAVLGSISAVMNDLSIPPPLRAK